MERTKGKWTSRTTGTHENVRYKTREIMDGNGDHVCELFYQNEKGRQHADTILDSVNAHDALVAALKACITEDGAVAFYGDYSKAEKRLAAINDKARAALALAKGESGA